MVRPVSLLATVMILAAACGDAAAPPAPVDTVTLAAPSTAPAPTGPAATPAGSAAPATDVPPATAVPAPPVTTAVAGPAAPDFSLALENRAGSFVLSDAATPVYLTFWAEW